MAAPVPKVGVAAVIADANGKFLVSKRKGGHGAGKFFLPLHNSPSPFDGILRVFVMEGWRRRGRNAEMPCWNGVESISTAGA